MAGAVDLNSDVGEGYGAWPGGPDAELMQLITSANVACGFHAGDPSIIRRTCEMAVEKNVAIGAHVSYPDLAGFGRRFIDMQPDELTDAVLYQLGALDAFARAAGSTGVATSSRTARCTTPSSATKRRPTQWPTPCDSSTPTLPLLGLPGTDSAIEHAAAQRGLAFCFEGFADRGYTPEGTLVPRGQPGALLTDGGCCHQAGHRARRARNHIDLPAQRHSRRCRAGHGGRGRPAAGRVRIAGLHPMRLLPCGPGAVLAEYDSLAEVLAVYEALRAADLPGVDEVVPAARTVLVEFHQVDRRALDELLVPTELTSRPHGPIVEIPVVYDGVDLDDVASATGLSSHGGHRDPFVGGVLRRVPGFHARLGLPGRAAPSAAPAASVDAAHGGPGGLGGHRQRVHRRLPDGQPRRLAPARPHVGDDVRRRPRQTGAGDGRRPSAIRADMIEIVNQGIGSTVSGPRPTRLRASRCRSQWGRRSRLASPGQPPRRQPRVGRHDRDVRRTLGAAPSSRIDGRSPGRTARSRCVTGRPMAVDAVAHMPAGSELTLRPPDDGRALLPGRPRRFRTSTRCSARAASTRWPASGPGWNGAPSSTSVRIPPRRWPPN